MGALLYDHALGHDGDDVSRLDGGQSVGDDQACPASPSLVQSILHSLRDPSLLLLIVSHTTSNLMW